MKTKKDKEAGCGCGCLMAIVVILVFLLSLCGSTDTADETETTAPVRGWLAEHESRLEATETESLVELVTIPEETTTEPETTEEVTTEPETETEEPTTEEERTYTYILNTNTKKIHDSGCSSARTIKAKNRAEWTGHSASEFLADHSGYSKCSRCHPY